MSSLNCRMSLDDVMSLLFITDISVSFSKAISEAANPQNPNQIYDVADTANYFYQVKYIIWF